MLELKNIRYNLAELPKGVSTTYPLATDGGIDDDEKGTQKVSTLGGEQPFTGATAGQDIINGWRYTAEIQKYLERCYREL